MSEDRSQKTEVRSEMQRPKHSSLSFRKSVATEGPTHHQKILRIAPGKLPPVNTFWSLTMYELPESLLTANPLNRYLINSPMAAAAQARCGRWHYVVHPERVAWSGQGSKLAASTQGAILLGHAFVLAEA